VRAVFWGDPPLNKPQSPDGRKRSDKHAARPAYISSHLNGRGTLCRRAWGRVRRGQRLRALLLFSPPETADRRGERSALSYPGADEGRKHSSRGRNSQQTGELGGRRIDQIGRYSTIRTETAHPSSPGICIDINIIQYVLRCRERRCWCPGAESNHRHCDFQSNILLILSDRYSN